MTTFISRLLVKRLNERLRFGERKAVYGISAGLVKRGPAGYFSISGTIRPDELDFSRNVIEEELAALRNGSHPDEVFESDRSVLVQQLRVSNASPSRWSPGQAVCFTIGAGIRIFRTFFQLLKG